AGAAPLYDELSREVTMVSSFVRKGRSIDTKLEPILYLIIAPKARRTNCFRAAEYLADEERWLRDRQLGVAHSAGLSRCRCIALFDPRIPAVFGEAGTNDLLTFVAQVRAQDMGEAESVAPLQHVEDRLVLLYGQQPARRCHRRHIACTADARRHRLVESTEHGIIGCQDDRLVNEAVTSIVADEITLAVMLDHLAMGGFDCSNLRIADAFAGEFAGERFQPLTNLEQITYVLICEFGCARATVRQELHQPFSCEHFERFAQRRARDLQPFT